MWRALGGVSGEAGAPRSARYGIWRDPAGAGHARDITG